MKNKFEIPIIVTVGLLAATTLYFIFTEDENKISTFKYDSIDYNDLISRNAKLGLHIKNFKNNQY